MSSSTAAVGDHQTAFDKVASLVTEVAIAGRSYPMFAFLFGYGIVQFYNSRRARGLDDRPVHLMLRRRHFVLVLLGLVHFMLLFEGDILGVYGLAGLLTMALFFHRKDKTTLVWICIWSGLLVLMAIAMGIGSYFAPDAVMGQIGSGLQTSASNPNYLDGLADKPLVLLAYPIQIIAAPIVPAMMLGWLAARRGILENPGQHRRLLTTMAVVGIPAAWLVALPGALANIGVESLDLVARY